MPEQHSVMTEQHASNNCVCQSDDGGWYAIPHLQQQQHHPRYQHPQNVGGFIIGAIAVSFALGLFAYWHTKRKVFRSGTIEIHRNKARKRKK
jgi:hypothetical protein